MARARRRKADPLLRRNGSPEDRLDHEACYAYDNLRTRFCGLELENPFLLAASPCTDDLEMLRRAFDAGWAGAVLKTTSVEGTPVDLAQPMLTSLDHGGRTLAAMGNCDLISVHHAREVEKRLLRLRAEFPGKALVASIMGTSRGDWEALVRRMEDAGADMIECSFSCPQGSMGEDPGRMLAQSAEATERAAAWVRGAARRIPVSIKITPQVTDIVEVARACERAGVNAMTASNSVPALMGVDIETFVPYPSMDGFSTFSGLTGPAIKPITLRTIAEIARHVRLPVLGTGGASDWRDAVEFLLVGAGVVQFCTLVMHQGFRVIDDLRSGLSLYLRKKKLPGPGSLVGRALPHIVAHEKLPRLRVRSRVVEAHCIGCGRCVIACRDGGHDAMLWGEDRIPRVDAERCQGCGLCIAVRPVDDCLVLEARDARGVSRPIGQGRT